MSGAVNAARYSRFKEQQAAAEAESDADEDDEYYSSDDDEDYSDVEGALRRATQGGTCGAGLANTSVADSDAQRGRRRHERLSQR